MELETAISVQIAAAINLRHRLHQIPELMYEEFETAATIRSHLDALDIPYIAGASDAPTATIALLGDSSRPCVALRADIDALPISENTRLTYASTRPGKMHACGHDGHSAILAATAGVLKQLAWELGVCVKLIWQPAEEGGAGALRLVEAGVLDGRIGPKVSAIFGLHGWPGLPLGAVATRPGALLAATDTFAATFEGKGCHGAFPHLGADPIVVAAEAVLNLQQCVSRDVDPTDPAVVTIGIFNAGTATNVIPDRAAIRGTARSLSETVRETLRIRIEQRCRAIADAGRCQLQFEWNCGYPATFNDADLAALVAATAGSVLGSSNYVPAGRPAMGGEDFAYYAQRVPACFFFIGVERSITEPCPPLHNDRFDFADEAIEVGVRMFVGLVQAFASHRRQ